MAPMVTRTWILSAFVLASLAFSACAGGIPAVQAEEADLESAQAEVEFTGPVEAMGATAWTVGGQSLVITAETEIAGAIALGDLVKVHALVSTDGTLTAREIERAPDGSAAGGGDETEFYGVVEIISAENWTVGGRRLSITSQTEIKGEIALGDFVKIHALVATDGSLTAHEIERVDALADEIGGDLEVEFTGTVEAIASDSWMVSGQSLAITPQTEIEAGIVIGDRVEVHALAGADGSLTALDIEREHDEDSGDGLAGDEVEFTGMVEALSAEAWVVAGQALAITADTEIEGAIQIGSLVKVHAWVNPDGSLTAREIELDGESDEDDSGPSYNDRSDDHDDDRDDGEDHSDDED